MSFSNEFNPLRGIILLLMKKPLYISSLMNQYKCHKNSFKKNPKLLLKLIYKLGIDQIRAIRTNPIYNYIAKHKKYQLNNYESLKGRFSNIYNNLKKYDIQKFTTDS